MMATEKEELPSVHEADDGGFEVDLSEGKETKEPKTEARSSEPDFGRDAAIVRAAVEGARIRDNDSRGNRGPDELTQRENALHETQRALGIEFEVLRASKQLTTAKAEEYDKKARELNQELSNIAAQRAVRGVLPELVRAQEERHYQTLYADVHSNPNALRYAKARFEMLAARGEPQSPQLVERAMNDARVTFGLGGQRSAPTDAERSKYTGASASASTRGTSPRVKLGKAEQSMAMAMYGDKVGGDEKKAYAMWAKGPGAKALKELNSRSRQ